MRGPWDKHATMPLTGPRRILVTYAGHLGSHTITHAVALARPSNHSLTVVTGIDDPVCFDLLADVDVATLRYELESEAHRALATAVNEVPYDVAVSSRCVCPSSLGSLVRQLKHGEFEFVVAYALPRWEQRFGGTTLVRRLVRAARRHGVVVVSVAKS